MLDYAATKGYHETDEESEGLIRDDYITVFEHLFEAAGFDHSHTRA